MKTSYLVKTGEINLKGNNKRLFEKKLFNNIKMQLGGIRVRIKGNSGRFYLEALDDETDEIKRKIEKTLLSVFGVVGYSIARKVNKNMSEIEETVLETVRDTCTDPCDDPGKSTTFKIHAKRADKSFKPDSHELACHLGKLVLDNFPALKVDVKNPDFIIKVEIREKAIIYSRVFKGQGGLPVGAAGKGLLLLSGGIDSPVAGFMMAKRGCTIEAIHFETYPYTSEQAREKVIHISEKLTEYLPSLVLHIVPFTETQVFIKQNCSPDEITLISRAAMMKIAHLQAEKIRANSIITGECLSQVASQTAESLRFTGSKTDYPILRPLIGFDKEEIIFKAREIGTYDISILPYLDCCSVFAPPRPLVKPFFSKIKQAWDIIPDLDKYIKNAFANIETIDIRG
ncbi:MAG: tRNA uracil 4-sulfurtransferase ThiI [Spirochaetia bacterium]|nr:tRNA uracil 4-sulfurtransferase ThiI [Spirochaetia bacterium]